jgi:hypothetical protein
MTNIEPSGGSVVLRRIEINLDTDIGAAFVTDCVRHIEGLISAEQLRKKYELDDIRWAGLAENEALQRLVGAQKERRIRNGEAARERAQFLLVDAVGVVGEIVRDPSTPVRSRIEGARELRATAAIGAEANTPAGERERFTIRIDLSAGGRKDNVIVRTFDKPLTPVQDENEPLRDENKSMKLIEPAHDETEDDYEPEWYGDV